MEKLDQSVEQDETAVITVQNLNMRYGELDVLKGVDFKIHRGEVIVLLGPNGAGKTTTLEVLQGFRAPSRGDVRVLGVDPMQGNEGWRAKLGVVLQSWRDHPKWKVHELLNHLGRYYELYSTPERKRPMDTDELIRMVGLEKQANKKLSNLSGGQRRRMDVAIGLVGRPEVLFLDEPTTGFDPKARRDFHEVILRLSSLEDTTILLTTHDLNEAEKLADRILILVGGQIVADGSSDQLSRQVASETEVLWSVNGEKHTHTTPEATKYVQELFKQHGDDIADLEVRRSSLEDTYIKMVHYHESGKKDELTIERKEGVR